MKINGYTPPVQDKGQEAEEAIKSVFIDLLVKEQKPYSKITNIKIAERVIEMTGRTGKSAKPEIFVQSLYQWFKKGKHTIALVIAHDFHQKYYEYLKNFFDTEKHLKQPLEELISDLNEAIRVFLLDNPIAFPLAFAPDSPASARAYIIDSTEKIIDLGAAFLMKRNVGERSRLVAVGVNMMVIEMHRVSFSLDENGVGSFNPIIEAELEFMLYRYLEPYFYPERFPELI